MPFPGPSGEPSLPGSTLGSRVLRVLGFRVEGLGDYGLRAFGFGLIYRV